MYNDIFINISFTNIIPNYDRLHQVICSSILKGFEIFWSTPWKITTIPQFMLPKTVGQTLYHTCFFFFWVFMKKIIYFWLLWSQGCLIPVASQSWKGLRITKEWSSIATISYISKKLFGEFPFLFSYLFFFFYFFNIYIIIYYYWIIEMIYYYYYY